MAKQNKKGLQNPPSNNPRPSDIFFKKPEVKTQLPSTFQVKDVTPLDRKKRVPPKNIPTFRHTRNLKTIKAGKKAGEDMMRNPDGDTMIENVLEFVPILGSLLSTDDVFESAVDKGVTHPDTVIESAGLIPAWSTGKNLIKNLKHANTASHVINKLARNENALKIVGGLSAMGAHITDTMADIGNLFGQEFTTDDWKEQPKQKYSTNSSTKKEKYLTGSRVGGMSPMGDPSKVLRQNQINWDKAQYEAESNPFTMGLDFIAPYVGQVASGLSTKQQANFQYPGMGYATGGQVTQQQVEVEGQEMFELPNGQVGKFTGPSHENGGIPVTLPTGTDIYSKRLKGEDGKTMAKRKEARTKERKALEDKMKKYPGDKLLKQTYERLVAAQDAIDHKDMQEMEAFKQLTESGLVEPNGKKFFNGGKIKSKYTDLLNAFKQVAGSINPIGDPVEDPIALDTAIVVSKPSVPTTPTETTPTTVTEETTQEATTNANRENLLGELGLDFTMGDGLGLIGNSMSALQPLQSARHAASMNTPNVNHYEGVGDRSLSKIESQKKFLDDFRTSAIQDILDRRATSMAQSRSSSRGVNQMRATDLAAYQSAEQSISQADQAYLQQMMQATSQEAQFLQQQDSALAQARTQVDNLNRQDLASTLSEIAQAKQDVWKGLANTGKTLNQAKENRVQLDLLNQMSNQFGVDKNGKVYGKGSNLSDLDLDLFFRNGFGVEVALAKAKGYDVDLKPDGVYDKKTGKKLTITDLQK